MNDILEDTKRTISSADRDDLRYFTLSQVASLPRCFMFYIVLIAFVNYPSVASTH